MQAYSGPVPYERDGLLLLHKEAYYHQGMTPLALLWKDAVCSRYVIDTDVKVRHGKSSVPVYRACKSEFTCAKCFPAADLLVRAVSWTKGPRLLCVPVPQMLQQ